MKKIFLMFLSISLLSACASQYTPVVQDDLSAYYNPEIHSRIRIYGQSNKPTNVWHSINCQSNPKGTKLAVANNMQQAFSSLLGEMSSLSIGMPETEISKNISSRSKFLSQAFYEEYLIHANQPVNIQSHFLIHDSHLGNGTVFKRRSCHGNKQSFIPKAGSDYEIVSTNGPSCEIEVYEIAQSGAIKPIPLSYSYSCTK